VAHELAYYLSYSQLNNLGRRYCLIVLLSKTPALVIILTFSFFILLVLNRVLLSSSGSISKRGVMVTHVALHVKASRSKAEPVHRKYFIYSATYLRKSSWPDCATVENTSVSNNINFFIFYPICFKLC
jgi:hypothetical protein